MIDITVNASEYDVKVTGHAGSGDFGHDLVCASVSILMYTLAQCISDKKDYLVKSPKLKLIDGDGHIRCKPKERYQPCFDAMYWQTCNGLKMLSDNYSRFVKLHVIEGENP